MGTFLAPRDTACTQDRRAVAAFFSQVLLSNRPVFDANRFYPKTQLSWLAKPPVFYGVKTLAYGYCAFYAYQLRARIVGAEPIAE